MQTFHNQPGEEAIVKSFDSPRATKAEPEAALINDVASIIQLAEKSVAPLPTVSTNTVSNITEMPDIRNYFIDSERVAEKIIEFEQGLAG